MRPITEDKIEQLTIEQLQSLGWEYVHGSIISPEGEKPERENYEQIILTDRLRKAFLVIIPHILYLRDTLLPKLMSGDVIVKI